MAKVIRPKQLADELGVDARSVRLILRAHFSNKSNYHWLLNQKQANEVRRLLTRRRPKKRGKKWVPTLARMKVGESFLLPKTASFGVVRSARSAISQYGRAHDKKFKVRKADEGYRCWRVE